MSKIDAYIKVLDDFCTQLRANISMLKDTTISYQDAWKIAEALDEIDVSDKVYVRRDDLQGSEGTRYGRRPLRMRRLRAERRRGLRGIRRGGSAAHRGGDRQGRSGEIALSE